MVTDAKDFELLGDPSKMTGYSRPPETKLTAVTRILGLCTAVGESGRIPLYFFILLIISNELIGIDCYGFFEPEDMTDIEL